MTIGCLGGVDVAGDDKCTADDDNGTGTFLLNTVGACR